MQITSKFSKPMVFKTSLYRLFAVYYIQNRINKISICVNPIFLTCLGRKLNKIRLKALHSITCVCICKCLLLVQTRGIWLLQNECYSENYLLSGALFQSLSTLWVLCLISLARGNNFWSSGEVCLKILNYRTLAIASVYDVYLSFKYEIPISTHK
jgi:hypothetical protein